MGFCLAELPVFYGSKQAMVYFPGFDAVGIIRQKKGISSLGHISISDFLGYGV